MLSEEISGAEAQEIREDETEKESGEVPYDLTGTPAEGCSTNDGMESAKLSLCATPPRKNTTSRAANSNAGVGIRYKITASIIDKATDAPVSADDYPSMVILFKDIDAADYLNKYASISSNTAAEVEARYNGDYAEHVELAENWFDPVVLAKNSSDPINTSLLKYFVRGNNMFIRGDGRKYYATGSVNDGNTLYSGFAASVPPSGFSFYWGASTNGNSTVADNYYTENIATNFGLQPTVAVWAKRSSGGMLTNSGQDEWQKNTHLMNSRGIYEYRPEAGYEVSSLKVDGEEQPLTDEQKNEGGTYVFERLNVDPVSLRYRSGDNILESGTSGHYEIEVTFVKKPDPGSLTVTKNVTGSLGDITKQFAFTVMIKDLPAGFEGSLDNSDAISDAGFEEDSYSADTSGAATLKFRLKDDASVKFTDLPAGAKCEVTEAESDHDPSYVLRREDTVIRSERLDMHGALSTGKIGIGKGEDITAEFTNNREIAPNTGSAHDGSDGPVTVSVALLALMALMLSWKLRRNRAE